MRIRPGEVRRLKTNDAVLVVSVNSTYVTVVPAFVEAKTLVGRYLTFKGVNFPLDYSAKISHVLVDEFISTIPLSLRPKIGTDAPEKFQSVQDRMQMLSYIDSEDDIRLVNRAEGR